MKQIVIFLSVILLFSAFFSCGNKNEVKINGKTVSPSANNYEGEKLNVTNKIMYDVPIHNEIIGDRSKNNPDWFWENLPSPEDNIFLKSLLDDAITGKLKTYYYDMTGSYDSFEEIPQTQLKEYMQKSLHYEFEVVDSTSKSGAVKQIHLDIDHTNITKLRFLEEWYIAEGKFNKRVIAIAPYFTIFHPSMDEVVNQVYFWILVDGQ